MAKTTKKAKSKKSVSKAKTVRTTVVESVTVTPVESLPTRASFKPMLSPKVLRGGLIVVLLGLLTYKAGPWLFPAVVGNMPVSRFTLYSRMEKAYGQQTLDEVVNEKVLDAAIKKTGVKVDADKVTAQITSLEKQFESVGGLDEALKQRGLTRAELEKQVRTQLSVEEILKDKINPTEEELKAEFDANAATIYKDKKYEDVKSEITASVRDAKLRDAFLNWFAEVKKDITVKNFGL